MISTNDPWKEAKMDKPWVPIEPLTEKEKGVNVSEFDSLSQAWEDARSALEEDNSVALARFQERLRRSWSVETGILENLYMIDRGATQTMIDKGFHAELVSRTSSDTSPSHLVDILKDHLEASDMLQAMARDGDRLTANAILQLHALITRHQDTVEAEDSLGNKVRTEVVKGDWKKLPNFRQLDDGTKIPYCPPEQVEGEIANLLEYLELQEGEDGVSPAIIAAWLHHRFTLMHPFQDGNGRVARALVNFLFVGQGLFPVVIDRDEKSQYIDALQNADKGDIEPLVQMLAGRQVEAIKQALSIAQGEDVQRSTQVKDLAAGIVERVNRRRQREQEEFRAVDGVLEKLSEYADSLLQSQVGEFKQSLIAGGIDVASHIDSGGTHDDRGHYYRWQIVESAQQAGQWANLEESSRWVRALIEDSKTRLRILLSFHHIGRQLSGVAEVTAIADLESTDQHQSDDEAERSSSIHCMLKPFSITWRNDPAHERERFELWLEECLLIALREWADAR